MTITRRSELARSMTRREDELQCSYSLATSVWSFSPNAERNAASVTCCQALHLESSGNHTTASQTFILLLQLEGAAVGRPGGGARGAGGAGGGGRGGLQN